MEQLFYLPSTMFWPLAACLVLTGIHVYLGVHVIARKVIFVDLALAQIAALGTMIGVLLGYEAGKDSTALYLYSLAFTIFGAFVFSATRMKGEKVPHEAIIGIVYAVTFAATILVLSQSALGPQELDHIIKGELLWVQGEVVIKTAVIYFFVGVFHFIFRKKFFAISNDPAEAEKSGIDVPLWDFLFYMSFGFVITSSVAIAGVFLVFSFLIIPSVGAMLLSDKLSTRLAIGWISGSIISFIGVKLSWNTGLPTSPLIVVVLAAALMLAALIRFLKMSEEKVKAVRSVAVSLIVVGIFIAGVFFFKKHQEDPYEHTLHLLESTVRTERQTALANLSEYLDKKEEWKNSALACLDDEDAEVRKSAIMLFMQLSDRSVESKIAEKIYDPSDEVKRAASRALRKIGTEQSSAQLLAASKSVDDPELQLDFLQSALELKNAGAVPELIAIIKSRNLFADDAFDQLRSHVEISFSMNEIHKIENWWKEKNNRIMWNEEKHMFVVQ
ncbi:MAG: metal ABC transporter permease [Bacteroidetes bacterium]|nr:metal ABC transporter permease [Bacteroidota bacterium]